MASILSNLSKLDVCDMGGDPIKKFLVMGKSRYTHRQNPEETASAIGYADHLSDWLVHLRSEHLGFLKVVLLKSPLNVVHHLDFFQQ